MEQAQENAARAQVGSEATSVGGNGGGSEVSAAYERARREVQDAVARLRNEIARIDLEQARIQARDWIHNNPELAALLALGGGLILGRVIGGALRPEPPPTLTKRIRHGAGSLASQAQRLAEEIGESVLEGAGQASEALARTARAASRQAQEVGSDLSKRASVAAAAAARGASEIGEELADRARTYGESASKNARRIAKTADRRTRHIRKDVSKSTGRGFDYAESALDAARTIVAAALIKRVNSWLKNVG